MRLLNVRTYGLEEFFEPDVPPYAILSHRWEQGEITFTDIKNNAFRGKEAYNKLQFACKQACEDCLDYVWIDTLCIDKSSSAELSEAINSMFRWYQEATVCYAFMSDVWTESQALGGLTTLFARSAWFTRGWTLQELIAPEKVNFYGAGGSYIGSRDSLCSVISRITRINIEVLRARQKPLELILGACTVAQRMSWAAHRQTTRIEDRAYSLIGIFAVNMPLLYGEGKRAFTRLQEEILKVGSDLSIFAWQPCRSERTDRRNLLAVSPENFAECTGIVHSPQLDQPFGDDVTLTMTNVGLRIDRPLVASAARDTPTRAGDLLLSLECRSDEDVTKVIALRLEPLSSPLVLIPYLQQRHDEQQSLCHVGWGDYTERLETINLLRPTRSSACWPFLTIPRELVPTRLSRQDAAIGHTHVWVDIPQDPMISKRLGTKFQWEHLHCHPERFWNLKNLTYNLHEAVSDARNSKKPSTGNNDGWIRGALALLTPWGNRISIFFAQRFITPEGIFARGNIFFKVLPYNPDTFPNPDEDLVDRDVVAHSIDIPPGRKAAVQLNNLRRPGILIAQLSVTSQPMVVDHLCKPPYELEASDSLLDVTLVSDRIRRYNFSKTTYPGSNFVPLPWLSESYVPFSKSKR